MPLTERRRRPVPCLPGPAGAVARVHRREHALVGEHAAQRVAEGQRGSRWRPTAESVQGSHPADGLRHRGVPRPLAVRPGLAVRGHPREDEAGIALGQHVIAESPSFQGPGSEALHHHVGGVGRTQEQLTAFVLAQIQRHATLVARVHGPEVVTVLFGLPPFAERIGPVRRLDLDDVCAVVGQQTAAERPRDQGAELEHPQAVQHGFRRRRVQAASSGLLVGEIVVCHVSKLGTAAVRGPSARRHRASAQRSPEPVHENRSLQRAHFRASPRSRTRMAQPHFRSAPRPCPTVVVSRSPGFAARIVAGARRPYVPVHSIRPTPAHLAGRTHINVDGGLL